MKNKIQFRGGKSVVKIFQINSQLNISFFRKHSQGTSLVITVKICIFQLSVMYLSLNLNTHTIRPVIVIDIFYPKHFNGALLYRYLFNFELHSFF